MAGDLYQEAVERAGDVYETAGAYNDRFEAWRAETLPRFFASSTGFSYLGWEMGDVLIGTPTSPEAQLAGSAALGAGWTYLHVRNRRKAKEEELEERTEELERQNQKLERATQLERDLEYALEEVRTELEEDDQ